MEGAWCSAADEQTGHETAGYALRKQGSSGLTLPIKIVLHKDIWDEVGADVTHRP